MKKTREVPVARYSKYCGPAVLAKALGISRLDAAFRLRACGAKKVGTHWSILSAALKQAGWTVRLERVAAEAYNALAQAGPIGRRRPRRDSYLPTLRQWRKAHPGAHVMLATTTHWLYLRGGRVAEHNGRPSARGRVALVLHLTRPA